LVFHEFVHFGHRPVECNDGEAFVILHKGRLAGMQTSTNCRPDYVLDRVAYHVHD
jgi:hypothetical protein